MFKMGKAYGLTGNDYRVYKLTKLYLTVIEITIR